MLDIKAFNNVLRVKVEELKYAMRSTDVLKDFGNLAESRRRAKLTKKVQL